jgi:DNA replication initiation complex subunit (GINS family)
MGKDSQDITVTYETLFELLRLEKNRDELQTLSPTFLSDVARYIREKQETIDTSGEKHSMFMSDRDKTLLENAKRLLKELYERREKKIIFMAMNKSRTGSNIMDTSSLLLEERELFEHIVTVLDNKRRDVLMQLLNGNQVTGQEPAEESKDTRLVKFTQAVPKFVGKELEIYGPFNEEDLANLPSEIADVLIRKGRAVGME